MDLPESPFRRKEMDILYMVNLRKICSMGTSIDLNHVEPEIPVPLVFQDPVRTGPQQHTALALVHPPEKTGPGRSAGMRLDLHEYNRPAIA